MPDRRVTDPGTMPASTQQAQIKQRPASWYGHTVNRARGSIDLEIRPAKAELLADHCCLCNITRLE